MIVTVSSVGGSPGVTSWAVLLAAAWPPELETERVVVEADLDGSVMGARFGIGVDPGTSSLVSVTRRSTGGSLDLGDIGRLVDPLAWLIPGPESAEASRQLWSTPGVADNVADAAARDHRLWFFDVGRAGPNGALGAVFDRASMSLLLCRAEHESLVQVPSRVAAMKRAKCFTGVMVIGKPSFSTDKLHSFFGSDRTWPTGPDDDVVAISRQVWGQRRVKRSQPWRSAVTVATDIAETLQSRTMEANAPVPELTDGR